MAVKSKQFNRLVVAIFGILLICSVPAAAVKIAIPYSDEDVKAGVSDLRIYCFRGATGTWQLIGGTADTANKVIVADVDSFDGKFAIFKKEVFLPSTTGKLMVFPSPAKTTINVCFDVATNNQIKMVIFNSIAEQVATIFDRNNAPGRYKISWNVSEFSGGGYLLQMQEYANNKWELREKTKFIVGK